MAAMKGWEPAMRILSILIAASLAGCTAYPLSSDVTSYESKDITRILRCQTRNAIVAKVAGIMEEFSRASPKAKIFAGKTGDVSAEYIRQNPFEIKSLRNGFSALATPAFRYYSDASVNYDFTIDSTEMNTAGIDLTLLKTFTSGSNSFGFGSRNDRTRQVKRQFRNYDSFESLLSLPVEACRNVPEAVNLLFPVVGLKRLDQLVDDFVEQNQSDNLGAKEHAEDAEMNDTMVFTTKTTGNFDPKFGRNSVPGLTVPTQLNVSLDNYRLDVHTVIILLRLPADRSKLPRFDSQGRLVLSEKQVIDNKFQQIRVNNFQDDVRNIGTNSISLFKLQ